MGKKNEISILNVLFCLMVIFIHVTSYVISSLSPQSMAITLFYPMWKLCGAAVYGFIFLSGMKLFLKKDRKVKLPKYYISRIKRVLIPYLIITVFYYVYEAKRGYFNFNINELIGFIINGNVESHLYFVVIIMQFYLLLPVWQYLLKKNIAIVLIITALLNVFCIYYIPDIFAKIGILNFIYNDRLFTSYVFFWIMGCFCGRYYNEFTATLKKYSVLWIVFFLITFAANTALSFSAFSGFKVYKITELVHRIYCVSAILFFYLIAVSVRDWGLGGPFYKLLNTIDNVSYEIYLIHIFFIHIINDLIARTSLGVLKAYTVRFLFVYIVSITACILYKYISNMLKSNIKKCRLK